MLQYLLDSGRTYATFLFSYYEALEAQSSNSTRGSRRKSSWFKKCPFEILSATISAWLVIIYLCVIYHNNFCSVNAIYTKSINY